MGLTSGGIRQEPLEMLPGETVVKIVSGGDHLVCLSNKKFNNSCQVNKFTTLLVFFICSWDLFRQCRGILREVSSIVF
jgi:hypothetical protein